MDDKGNILGILSVGNDITDLKRTETELKRSRDELEIRVKERTAELEKVNKFLLNEIEARKRAEKEIIESEEMFRTLAETSPVAIFFHRGVSFIYANPAAEKILGRSLDEIEKMNFWELFAPEYQQMIKERGLARLRGENPPARYEVRLQTETEKWMEITSKRLMYKGNPAILTIGLDVTQYKQTLTALNESKVEAELYVDLMSHDIININQIGAGNLELLADDLVLNELEKERLSKAVLAFKSSSQLIDNVKKLRKAKKCELNMEKQDIGPILDKVKNNYLAVPGREVTINLEPVRGLYVCADQMLYDVFSNIVDNSIKHSKGNIEINIHVDSVEVENKMAYRIMFEDNGPGINPDLQKRIFNRMFYDRGIMRGKGLGLYLVKVLVGCFHGDVSVEDRVQGDRSKGTRFVVMLPAVEK
jgi:PAS domain S-box-containing protein